jgi:hypothetical protein
MSAVSDRGYNLAGGNENCIKGGDLDRFFECSGAPAV